MGGRKQKRKKIYLVKDVHHEFGGERTRTTYLMVKSHKDRLMLNILLDGIDGFKLV